MTILKGSLGTLFALILMANGSCSLGIGENVSEGFYRVRDADAGVTCWTVYQRGISCLRDEPHDK
jgi:hypothetical protein